MAGRIPIYRRVGDVLRMRSGKADRGICTSCHRMPSRALPPATAQLDDLCAHRPRLHRRTNRPFETARTELRYGQRLRRRKSKSDARTHLRAAWETFSAIGADCWTACAHNELEATGVRLTARALTGADRLTPQELQIALAVCEGASNRHVAERLFVSAKTVEYHLSHVYRKLSITSRTALGTALARATPQPAAPAPSHD